MITLIKQPNTFHPAENPIIFEFSSDNANLVYFKFELKKDANLIQVFHLYPTPAITDKAYINLSSILKNYVKTDMKSYAVGLVDLFPNATFKYNFKITEMIASAGSVIEGANYNSTSTYIAFVGKMDNISFKNYTNNAYVVNSSSPIIFLNSKPSKVAVNDFSNEGLYFLQNNFNYQLTAKYELYDANDELVYTLNSIIPDQNTNYQYRINTSLKKLKEEISSINFDNVAYYTVKLVDENSIVKSEVKTYIKRDLQCHLHPVNIIWANKMGVMETIQMYQPEYTFSSSKAVIEQSLYKFDSSGNYSSSQYNVFNIVEKIINSTTEQTIKLNTQPLTDTGQNWLSSIQDSRQIYLQADIDLYIPVRIVDSSYNIKSHLYTNEPTVKQLTFKLSDGFTPDFIAQKLNPVTPNVESIETDFYNY